ncbi:Coactosin-like protein [Daphnia magna]|uniref:Coactosin-like protein n=1 Tax=Daphnia magna TaxID=35525 RepID=A0A164HLJ1_9CRUS|nr:Coactosin-like protein [Daphnia magna]
MEQHQQSEAIKHRAQRIEAYQFMQISIHTGISHKLDFSFEIFARAVFQFEGNQICSKAVGSDFADFRTQFVDDERAFGFVRIQSGDEMSKRTKFLFVTWLGPNVSTMKRARLSSDKALVKEIIMNFAVELQIETADELNYEFFREAVHKAGGANYGTGVREL